MFTQQHSTPPWPGSLVSAKLFLAVCLPESGQGIQRITSQHVYNHSGWSPVMAEIWLAYHQCEPGSLSGINRNLLASTPTIHGFSTTWSLASHLSVCPVWQLAPWCFSFGLVILWSLQWQNFQWSTQQVITGYSVRELGYLYFYICWTAAEIIEGASWGSCKLFCFLDKTQTRPVWPVVMSKWFWWMCPFLYKEAQSYNHEDVTQGIEICP